MVDGEDLDDVARRTGTSTDRVIAQLCAADLRVAFLGFAPGFPYLTGLPPELAALPRRDAPRTSVPAGSVAIGGGFASVYPRASPGGWHLLGRTDVPLFDPDAPPFALVHPGDRVRFTVAAGAAGARAPERHQDPRPALVAGDRDHLEIVDPGVLSLIQDGGRRATASLGIPRGGAADQEGLVLANRLVGNPDTAAAVECTAVGPTVRVAGRGHLAVGGPGSTGGRHPCRRHALSRPTRWCLSPTGRPCRSAVSTEACVYLAGGRSWRRRPWWAAGPRICSPASALVRSGAGDRLARGRPGPVRRRQPRHPPPFPGTGGGITVLRALAGPHPFPEELLDRLYGTVWRIGSRSDRIGLRLEAPGTTLPVTNRTASTGMVTGAVQIPP